MGWSKFKQLDALICEHSASMSIQHVIPYKINRLSRLECAALFPICYDFCNVSDASQISYGMGFSGGDSMC